MKADNLRKENVESLSSTLTDLLREQFNLRMQKATGQLGTVHQLKQVRRDIARVNTVISEKQKGA